MDYLDIDFDEDNETTVMYKWMSTKLKLKGSELITFAKVFNITSDGIHKYYAPASKLAEWCNITPKNELSVLAKLTEKGLLIKEEHYENGVKFCKYYVPFKRRGGAETELGGGAKTVPNNSREVRKEEKERNSTNVLKKVPTLEEAKAYAEELKYYDFNVEGWYKYNCDRGWRLNNGKPCRDWKQCMVTSYHNGYNRIGSRKASTATSSHPVNRFAERSDDYETFFGE